jgi:hypothetical protein
MTYFGSAAPLAGAAIRRSSLARGSSVGAATSFVAAGSVIAFDGSIVVSTALVATAVSADGAAASIAGVVAAGPAGLALLQAATPTSKMLIVVRVLIRMVSRPPSWLLFITDKILDEADCF